MDYKIAINNLQAKDFLRLWKSVGWDDPPLEHQVEAGLKKTLFSVTVSHNDQVVGMGRLVGDGYIICYIQELAVLPEFQGKGIGKAIMEKLLGYISDNAVPDTHVVAGLFAAKNKEAFYENFGFNTRPNDTQGAGMQTEIKSKS